MDTFTLITEPSISPSGEGVCALAAASLPGAFCLMACRARWNQPQAVNNKPAESSWEEEEQIQELFRKTHQKQTD